MTDQSRFAFHCVRHGKTTEASQSRLTDEPSSTFNHITHFSPSLQSFINYVTAMLVVIIVCILPLWAYIRFGLVHKPYMDREEQKNRWILRILKSSRHHTWHFRTTLYVRYDTPMDVGRMLRR
jgi:hypothetical protein